MRLGNRAADRKSKSHAARCARCKRLEERVTNSAGNTRAIVGQRNADALRIVTLCRDTDPSGTVAAVGHCLEGIRNEVAQSKLDLHTVDIKRWKVAFYCGCNCNVILPADMLCNVPRC